MLLTCPRCRTQFSAPDSAFADGPLTVRCSLCKYTWRHPEGVSKPGEKPNLSTGTISSGTQAPSSRVPEGRETQPSQAKTSVSAPPRSSVSETKPSAPIPEFTSGNRTVETYKNFMDQKPDLPEFRAPSTEIAATPEQRPAKIQAPTRETQTEIAPAAPAAPVAPAAMLSATTDGFSTADRSFFETDYATSDTQAPVITMSELRQSTAAERQTNDAYSTSSKKQSGYGIALAVCLLIFAALVWAGWYWLVASQSRQVSVNQSANPVAERTLEFRLPSFGLGKSIEGLEFYDVVAAYRIENGESRLIVEGEIRNTSNESKDLLPLRAVLFDDGGQPIADWIFDGGKPALATGENLRFHTVLKSPPTAAVNYEVAFTDSQPK